MLCWACHYLTGKKRSADEIVLVTHMMTRGEHVVSRDLMATRNAQSVNSTWVGEPMKSGNPTPRDTTWLEKD